MENFQTQDYKDFNVTLQINVCVGKYQKMKVK